MLQDALRDQIWFTRFAIIGSLVVSLSFIGAVFYLVLRWIKLQESKVAMTQIQPAEKVNTTPREEETRPRGQDDSRYMPKELRA
jgi:hypothetical protein